MAFQFNLFEKIDDHNEEYLGYKYSNHPLIAGNYIRCGSNEYEIVYVGSVVGDRPSQVSTTVKVVFMDTIE